MKQVSAITIYCSLFMTEMLLDRTLTVLLILLGFFQRKTDVSEIFYIDLLDFGAEFALFLLRTVCMPYIAFGFIGIDFNDVTLQSSWW
jgi:hypothetical protein